MKTCIQLLAIIALLGWSSKAMAQDIIIDKNAEEMKVKVIEITDTHIKYKKFSNLDGPTYNIEKTKVFKIKYEKGGEDIITPNVLPQAPASTAGQGEFKEVEHVLGITDPTLRKNNYEFGIRAEGSLSYLKYSKDYDTFGALTGVGAFFEAYNGQRSYTLVGFALAHTWSVYTYPDEHYDLKMNRLAFDIYIGDRGSWKEYIYSKTGARFYFPLKASLVNLNEDIDVKEYVNWMAVGWYTEVGFTYKKLDVGAQFTWVLTDSFKSDYGGGGTGWDIGLTCAYRF